VQKQSYLKTCIARKQIVAAMMANGRCSREQAQRRQQVLDFAIAREKSEILASVKKLDRSWWGKFWSSAAGDIAGFILLWGALFHFGFGIRWLPAIFLAMLIGMTVRDIAHPLQEIHRSSQRLIDLTVYSVAHLISQREPLSIYEARSKVEYMRYPEIEFESELLEEDLSGFYYEISCACDRGCCGDCDGTCRDYSKGSLYQRERNDPRTVCLHDCHNTRTKSTDGRQTSRP
jgi:hypothetical protein